MRKQQPITIATAFTRRQRCYMHFYSIASTNHASNHDVIKQWIATSTNKSATTSPRFPNINNGRMRRRTWTAQHDTNNLNHCIYVSSKSSSSSSSLIPNPHDNGRGSDNTDSMNTSRRPSNQLKSIDYENLTPINFDTSSKIKGDESQILEIDLAPNQSIRAESGAMIYMTQNVQMSTSLGTTNTEGGGSKASTTALSQGLQRLVTGQNLFISDYSYHGPLNTMGTVALGTAFPSKIVRLSLSEYNHKIICQKSAYLASDIHVDIQMEFTKRFTTGFFGGEGFILQGLIGDGDVFVKAGGTLVQKELEEGETLRISSGSLVAFTQDVEYDVQTMPGFKNVLFGGEGLFVTTLTGPGTIWLQGMPPDRMISEIARRVPSGGGIGMGIPIGLGGGGNGQGENSNGENDEVADATNDRDGEGLVASTDAATEADRNATVASSGIMEDSESTNALFGDATPPASDLSWKDGDDFNESNNSIPDLDDSTSFSTKETNFEDDFTKDQFDNFQQDETSFSAGGGSEDGGGVVDDGSEGGKDMMSTIWDLFFNDDE